MQKRIELNTPEPGVSVTHLNVNNISLEVKAGTARIVFDRCDANGVVIESTGFPWTPTEIALEEITDLILASAQAAGGLPPGTIE